MAFFKRRRFARRAVDVMSTFTFAIFAVTIAVSATVSAQDIAPNTAAGSITVNENKIEFRYAYALTRPSLSSKKPETVLIISDQPVAASAVADDIKRMQARRRDDLKMIEIKFDDRKTLGGTNFEVAPLVVSAFSTEFRMTVENFTDNELKGRFCRVSEHKMRDNLYSFDVRFNAAMMVPPSSLSGKEA